MTALTEKTFPKYDFANEETSQDSPLYWSTLSSETVFKGPIFNVETVMRSSNDGRIGKFSVVTSGEWTNVIPVFTGTDGEKYFVMEKQFRHGNGKITVEFPGGIVEKGEAPERAALRELEEETGLVPKKITRLGEVYPNAAFINSHGTIFLAEDCSCTGVQHLDPNEIIDIVCVPVKDALEKMGAEPFNHGGLLISAFFYLRHEIQKQH